MHIVSPPKTRNAAFRHHMFKLRNTARLQTPVLRDLERAGAVRIDDLKEIRPIRRQVKIIHQTLACQILSESSSTLGAMSRIRTLSLAFLQS